MSQKMVDRLHSYFEDTAGDDLRSIVRYGPETHEMVYIRPDVETQYTEAEVAETVDESRMESLTAPIYRDAFATDHGDLHCMVKCFANAIEMNFVLADAIGTAVGLDATALDGSTGLVAGARRIVVEERDRAGNETADD